MSRVARGERFSAAYGFGSAVIDVDADDRAAARWLAEFLSPWFERREPGQGEFLVRQTCSAPLFAGLARRQAAVRTAPVACFALDSRVVELPGWREEDGHTVIADAYSNCFHVLRPPSVEIIGRPGTRRIRVGLMRAVRELAAARILGNENMLDLHAAAFAVGDRSVLLVGQKRAGKTTLLVSVLKAGRGALVANDRVFVDLNEHPGQARGVPTLVAVRAGTLAIFPDLQAGLPPRPALMHAGELETPDASTVEDSNPSAEFGLSSTQLARRLSVPIVPCAPLAAVLFPEISAAVDTWSLEPVDPLEGAAQLHECAYGARSGPRLPTVFEQLAGNRHPDRNTQRALTQRLATRIPFFRLRLGRNAYRDGAAGWLCALPL